MSLQFHTMVVVRLSAAESSLFLPSRLVHYLAGKFVIHYGSLYRSTTRINRRFGGDLQSTKALSVNHTLSASTGLVYVGRRVRYRIE